MIEIVGIAFVTSIVLIIYLMKKDKRSEAVGKSCDVCYKVIGKTNNVTDRSKGVKYYYHYACWIDFTKGILS